MHAEDVDVRRSQKRSALRSTAIPPPPWTGITACSPRRSRTRRARLLRDEGELEPGSSAGRSAISVPGMDIVSEGELRRALAAGVPAERIVFSGVGKTRDEMALPSTSGILCFNVESEPELETLSEIAVANGRDRAPISIRVNPDVDAKTHKKISTGKSENKFGIPIAARPRGLCPRGRAAGRRRSRASTCISAARSPTCAPFDNAFALLAELVARPAGRRPCHRTMSISAAASAFPTATTTRRRPTRRPMPRSCKRIRRRLGLQAGVRAGPPDRRQCRHPRDPGRSM